MGKIRKKETDYFEFFSKSADCACRAARFMDESFMHFSHDIFPERVERMHELEHEADANKHEMMRLLAHEFMTPIEREDIVSLSQELDNVVDSIDDIMRMIYMFDISDLRAEVTDFSRLTIRCCDELAQAVAELKDFKTSKTIHERVVAVNTIESDGDTLHAESVHRLCAENADARTTMLWIRLFDGFENCLDACEDAVDVIEGIIMKNS